MIRFKMKKGHLWVLAGIVIYKLSLDIAYHYVISKVWYYERLTLDANYGKLLESYCLLVLIYLLMPKDKDKVSTIIIWLIILFSYLPMLTIFGLKNESRTYIYFVSCFWLITGILSRLPTIRFRSLKQNRIALVSLVLSLILIGIVLIVPWLLSLRLDALGSIRVYDIRMDYMQRRGFVSAYILNWLAYVIIPLSIAIFLKVRNWLYLILIIAFQILIFFVTGIKAFLFAPFFVMFVVWILNRGNAVAWTCFVMAGIMTVCLISYEFFNDVWLAGLFVERSLFDPAQLSFFYYDFFSNHEPIYLSAHRFFRNILDYPFYLDPPRLISFLYFNKLQGSANSGIVADGYMNFGFAGLIGWAILLIIILKIVDCVSITKDKLISVSAVVIPMVIGLTNSPLLTTLLTHGLLMGMLLVWLLPIQRDDEGRGVVPIGR